MKKIILGTVALVILGGGAAGYSIWSKKTGAPPLPNIMPFLSSERSLHGFWTVKEVYATDPATGELKLLPAQGGKTNSYFEFRGGMFCINGQLDPERKPYPCQTYQPFSVSGDKINIEDPSRPMTMGWKFVSGNLELTLEASAEGGKTQKIKFVLTKL